jgi:hypothetical protein
MSTLHYFSCACSSCDNSTSLLWLYIAPAIVFLPAPIVFVLPAPTVVVLPAPTVVVLPAPTVVVLPARFVVVIHLLLSLFVLHQLLFWLTGCRKWSDRSN